MVRQGLSHHQAGRFAQAEAIYRRVLAVEPGHPGALHLLGVLASQAGRHDRAVQYISDAIRRDGFQPVYHTSLGEAYRGLGQLDVARTCYERALQLNPNLAEAHNNLGTILQALGDIDGAIAAYRRAIDARPRYVDAHNNLGTALERQGQPQAAIECFQKAVELDPNYAKAHYNLGAAFLNLGRLDESLAATRRALELKPNDAAAHYHLALLFDRRGQLAEAHKEYHRALRDQPNFVEASLGLATIFRRQGKMTDAIAYCRAAVEIRPDYAEALFEWALALEAQGRLEDAALKYREVVRLKPTMAEAHYNLGIVLHKLARLDEAAAAYEEALRVRPDFHIAQVNLGNVYKDQSDTPRAIACYERALAAFPDDAKVYNNLGRIWQDQDQLDRAEECYRQAIRCEPAGPSGFNNLGAVLQERGESAKALACYDKCLRLEGNFAEAHYNRGRILLAQQQFAEGWKEFEWRTKCRRYPARSFVRAAWDGTPLPDAALLVYAEQGLGDTLHFARYVTLARGRARQVIFEVQPALVPLLRMSGFEEAVPAGAPLPPFGARVPLLSLPGIFGTDAANLPAEIPYLQADPKRVAAWNDRLARIANGFRVGIQWQGNPAFADDRRRSFPLERMSPLAAVEGIGWFSLQKHEGRQQLPGVADRWTIHDLGTELDEHGEAFVDTAAVMMNLDLVITSDTATAHLAGGLGVKVWVALSCVPDWRWFLDREDSPWYPTMRLFRQKTPGDWADVFHRMAGELARTIV